MNVGIIGLGGWGSRVYSEYSQLASEGKLRLGGICDVDYTKFPYDAPYHTTDYHELLKQVDAVHICVPNHLHYLVANDALEAGKHVLIEKPMSHSSESANTLSEVAHDNRLVLGVGHIYRYNCAVDSLKEVLRGAEIYNIVFNWSNQQNHPEGVDIVWDLGIHPLDIYDSLFDLQGHEVHRRTLRDGTILNVGGYPPAYIFLSWDVGPKTRSVELYTSRGLVRCDFLKQEIGISRIAEVNGVSDYVIVPKNNTIRDEVVNFVDAAESGGSMKASGGVGVKLIKVLEAIK